ncbi:hypothetical protein CDCA_CDCA09G2568 [Cyanidium caldarium]|uniref:Dihydrolipoamide acetyltransferase component of pyruvate dehydrogenase complex n=1 Tax=Cyanidium caldarium TaxID=2771 RepID=A0AAV9IWS7_CYACA|nr:hypothetical protein CDCA_CDCA09G2568 [Cyanidium caldarium]
MATPCLSRWAALGRSLANRALTHPSALATTSNNTLRAGPLHLHARLGSSAALPAHIKLRMPALSPTMKQGNLVKWSKQEGDEVGPGEVLAEIETDKATVEFESQDEGVLAKIIVPAGTQDVPVGRLVAVLAEDASNVKALQEAQWEDGEAEEAAPATAEREPEREERAAPPPPPPPSRPAAPKSEPKPSSPRPAQAPPARVFASPLARRMAQEAGVDLTQLRGTGPSGRVVAADVAEAGPPGEAAAEQVPSPEAMQIFLESKREIPHYQLVSEVRLDAALRAVEWYNRRHHLDKSSDSAKPDTQPAALEDMLIRALATAAKRVPQINATFRGTSIRQFHSVDVAVQSGDSGTLSCVIRGANDKGLGDIRALRAAGNHRADDVGTIAFAFNNRVMQHIAIIRPPHAAILVVGRPEARVVPDGNGSYTQATVAVATASLDHRVIDGAVGAQFMAHFQQYVQEPLTMLD